MTYIIIGVVIVVLITVFFILFSKKCVSTIDPVSKQKSGNCYYLWQKGLKTEGQYNVPMNISDGRIVSFPDFTITYLETVSPTKEELANFNKEMEKQGWPEGPMIGSHQYFNVCEKNSDICQKIDLSAVPFHSTSFMVKNIDFTIKNGDNGNFIIIKN